MYKKRGRPPQAPLPLGSPEDAEEDAPDDADRAFRVACLFMNEVVVSLADSESDGNAEVFGRAHHVLLALARKHPALRLKARADLERFAFEDGFRAKEATPDLGAFLASTSLCAPLEDEALRVAFRDAILDEVLARNVLWVTKKTPWLGVWLPGEATSVERLGATFENARISATVVAFQCFFLGAMSRAPEEGGLAQLDASFGRASAAIRAALRSARDAIRGFRHYGDFAAFLGASWTPCCASARLRNAVRKSATRGYTPWLRVALEARSELGPEEVMGDEAGSSWAQVSAAWSQVRETFSRAQRNPERRGPMRKRERIRRTTSAPQRPPGPPPLLVRREISCSEAMPLPPPPVLRRELSEEGKRLLREL